MRQEPAKLERADGKRIDANRLVYKLGTDSKTKLN